MQYSQIKYLPSASSRSSREPALTKGFRPLWWGLLLGEDSTERLLPLSDSLTRVVPHAFTLYRSESEKQTSTGNFQVDNT